MFAIIFALLLSASFGTGTAPDPVAIATEPEPSAITVDESEDGQTVRLRPGQRLTVELEENPTTPYSWSVLQAPDVAVLEAIDDEYETGSDCPEGASGCGGAHTWEFRATGSGATRLVLGEGRGGGEPPAETFDLRVTVAS